MSRLSVTLVYCIQMAKDIVKLLSRTASPHQPSFLRPSGVTQFQGEPTQRGGGVIYTSGGKKMRYSTEIAVYLGHGTR